MSAYLRFPGVFVRLLSVLVIYSVFIASNLYLPTEANTRRSSLLSVALNPQSLVGGTVSQGTVTLRRAAPSGGTVVWMSSSNTSIAAVPASVTVSAGATSANFNVVTSSVGTPTTVQLTGASGDTVKTAQLTLNPAYSISSLTLNPVSLIGGNSSQGTITLTSAAPLGAVISLSSSNASVATVPATATVAPGATSAGFTVATQSVAALTSVTISGVFGGATKTAQLSLNPLSPPPPPSGSPMLYVNPAGSDSNPGTLEQPFRTIQRAADLVNPGDTVIVQDGVYTDPDGDRVVVKLRRGGTSTARITFLSEHRWGARIDGQNNTSRTGFEFSTGANWIRLEGFEVYGVGNDSQTDGASGILVYNGGSDVEIVGNHLHDIGRACTDTANGENAIFVGNQNRVLIEGNLIHDIGRFAPGEQGCNPSSSNYQNHDHGLYINRANDVTVRNNVLYNCKRGWCIQVYPGPSDRIKIHNNTFAFENPYRDGHIIVGADGAENEIENNIFYDPLNAAIRLYSGTQTNMIIANNMIYGGGVYNGTATLGVLFISNWPYTDPRLVSPQTYDFHLSAFSPAIDTGLSIFSLTNIYDFGGVIRPQGFGYDLGAWERVP